MATWTFLTETQRPLCASARHDVQRVPADWRMKSGDIGSYYCTDCRARIIVDDDGTDQQVTKERCDVETTD